MMPVNIYVYHLLNFVVVLQHFVTTVQLCCILQY